MKIVLPVAGNGMRLRPYTEDLPKCLLPVAGKPIIDWIVEDSQDLKPEETIFITGYKAEQMDEYLAKRTDWGKTRAVRQENPQGLGEAISLALPFVDDGEPLLIILGDTLFEADLSILKREKENVLYTFRVEDPSRFGVAVTNAQGRIERLEEKPQKFVSDEAIVGIYFIRDVRALKDALAEIMKNDRRTKGEFQLTDALQTMIEAGCKFHTAPVQKWLDCGLVETLLDTNAYVISRNDNSSEFSAHSVKGPCHIGKNVTLINSRIGPNVAVGDNCVLKNCKIKNAILWDGVRISGGTIENTIVHR